MKSADLILKNGKILSVANDGRRIRGSAVAVTDGLITAVGDDMEIESISGERTKIIDCRGHTILPGLCDAHCHPSGAIEMSMGCDLFGIYIQKGDSSEQVIDKYLQRLGKHIEENPRERIVRGSGWIFGNFTEKRLPNRHDLDRICRDKPVVLRSFCGHVLWVNSKAIELSGLNENTPDVYAGKIFREKTGYPSGIFKEIEAKKLIEANLPEYGLSVEEYKEGIIKYQREEGNKYGVTMIQDCAYNENATEAYRQLAKEGKLTVRFRGVYPLDPANVAQSLDKCKQRKSVDDAGMDFKIETVKMFAEGPFALLEPYEKSFVEKNGYEKNYNGELFWKDEDFIFVAEEAIKAGFSVHVHAMGDKAVKQSVNCLANAQRRTGKKCRNVIAHCMLIKEEDIVTMGKEKIIANLQPRWMVYDSDINAVKELIGEQRAQASYPQKSFWNENVTVAYGTDFPVTPPPDTMHEIQCALTRKVFPGAADYEKFKGMTLGNEDPISLEEAVQALSINGAYQMFAERETGSIEIGKSADLAILDSDLEAMDPNSIYAVEVEKTIFKGEVVYEKQED